MFATRPALALAVLALGSPSFAQENGRKVAVLVGVGQFKHDLTDLKGSPQKDVAELGKVLKAGGFEVVTLTDARATKDAIETAFRTALNGSRPGGGLGRGDILLVAVCTHGFSLAPAPGKPDEPFVAGYDAKPGQPETMVALNALFDAPKGSGATCLFLVDACREDPNRGRGQVRGVEPTTARLPKGTAVLFACQRGELSHQHEKAGGHGLFTYAVLKALKPVAGGKVSWNRLLAGVEAEFESPAMKAMIPAGKSQVPVATSGELGAVTLLVERPAVAGPPPPAAVVTKSEPPAKGKTELVVGGKARVQPAGGADAISSQSSKNGGDNLGVPEIDRGTVVTIKEIVGGRCRVEWADGKGGTHSGWLNATDLTAE